MIIFPQSYRLSWISTKKKKKYENVNSEPIYNRFFSNGNINNLNHKLLLVKWDQILDGRDAGEDYYKFTELFMLLYDECISLKKIKLN